METVLQPGLSCVIFQCLTLSELLTVVRTSRAFLLCATQDEVWRGVCAYMFPYSTVERDCFAYFQQNKRTFLNLAESLTGLLKFLETHASNARMVTSFYSTANPLARQIFPRLVSTSDSYLSLYPSESQTLLSISRGIISSFESQNFCEMPLELYYFYLLCNGQEASNFTPSVVGSYKFNHEFVNPVFLSLQKPRERSMRWFIVAECPYSVPNLQIIVDVTNVLSRGNSAVCLTTSIPQTVLYLCPSLSHWFSSVLQKLQANVTDLNQYVLDAFERNANSSVAVTQGIEIEARTHFVSHQSDSDQYLWAYEIRIRPSNPQKRWRLATRRWEIADISGFRHTVEGSGVVGLYPEVYLGSREVVYESCCLLHATEGWMQGEFTFQNMDEARETVRATVARFFLRLPEGSELLRVPRFRTSSDSS